MIHHVSLPARDPAVLAEPTGGVVVPCETAAIYSRHLAEIRLSAEV